MDEVGESKRKHPGRVLEKECHVSDGNVAPSVTTLLHVWFSVS